MNPLELLKKADPQLYTEFLRAITKDLGLTAGSLQCPNCKARFRVLLESQAKSIAGRKSLNRRQVQSHNMPKAARGSLFQLIVDLARLRGTTTGVINRQFKQSQKPSKKLSVQEVRDLKIGWLKHEIGKAKKAA